MKVKIVAPGVPFLAETYERILNAIPNVEAELVKQPKTGGYQINYNEIDVLWNIGFFFNVDCLFDQVQALYPHVQIVNIWVGSDILQAQATLQQRPKCAKCLFRGIDFHLADGINLQQELKQFFNIDSVYVPSVPDPIPLTPLPRPPYKVAVYAPCHRKEFYRHEVALQVASQKPGMLFDFYSISPDPASPGPGQYHSMANCTFRGFLRGQAKLDAFSEAHVLFEFPQHGSVALTLIEFMMMGRGVVASINAPFVHQVSEPVTDDKVIEQLDKAIKALEKGPNKEASEHYHREYGFAKVHKALEPVIGRLEDVKEYV